MTQKTVVDCTPQRDSLGRTLAPLANLVDLTPAEQAVLDSRVVPPRVETATMQCGRVSIGILDGLAKAVVFPKAMASTGYVVTIANENLASVNVWTSNRTDKGFTLNVSVAVNLTVAYIASLITT